MSFLAQTKKKRKREIYIYIYIQGVALRIDPKFDCWVYFAFQKYSVFAGFERKKTQK